LLTCGNISVPSSFDALEEGASSRHPDSQRRGLHRHAQCRIDAWRRMAGNLMQAFAVEAAQPLPEALTRTQVYRALKRLNDPPA
jgi:hypothetical protein